MPRAVDSARRTSVLIADDDEQICQYLRRILGRVTDLQVLAHALNGNEAVQLVDRLRPDVLLLDVRMPGADGLSVLAQLVDRTSVPAVLLLTNFNDEAVLGRAIALGAAGVLLKSATPADLIGAIRLAAAGHRILGGGARVPWPAAPAAPALAQTVPAADLTDRELDVLGLLGQGLSNRSIAERLDLSPATIKGHISSLMLKLDCESRLQLGLLAQRRAHSDVRPPT